MRIKGWNTFLELITSLIHAPVQVLDQSTVFSKQIVHARAYLFKNVLLRSGLCVITIIKPSILAVRKTDA